MYIAVSDNKNRPNWVLPNVLHTCIQQGHKKFVVRLPYVMVEYTGVVLDLHDERVAIVEAAIAR